MQLKFFIGLTSLFSSVILTASPSYAVPVSISKSLCGTEDSVQYGDYNVYNNLVGRSKSGSQCTELISSKYKDGGKSVAWRTAWSWSGESKQIKSFANAAYHHEPISVSKIKSIPITWDWKTTGNEKKRNVALNLFTSEEAPKDNGENYEHQIEIWLGRTGKDVKPLGNKLNDPPFVPSDRTGNTYQLYSGYNGVQTVFTFVATKTVHHFDEDALLFIQELVNRECITDSQVLGAIRGGITAYVGDNAEFTTTHFQVSIN